MARRRPRVAVDVTPLLYRGTGIARFVGRLAALLPEAAPELDVVLFGRRMLGGAPREVPRGARVARLRMPRRAEPLIARLGLVEALVSADLYHATDFYLPLRSPDRAVATVHDVIFLREPEPTPDHRRLARRAPPFLRGCRRIAAISEYTKRELVAALGVDPARIAVIPLAVDRELFRPVEDEAGARAALAERLGLSRPYFFSVSCSLGRKNTPALLEAYARLLPHDPANDLVLAWKAPDAVRSRWEELGGGRIRFVAEPPDEVLRLLYGCATAVVYPSRSEGFGLPLLEAMGCGAPVISSSAAALPEVGGDAPLYVDPLRLESLVEALERFENGTADTAGMRSRGLARAGAHRWESVAAATAALYREALQS